MAALVLLALLLIVSGCQSPAEPPGETETPTQVEIETTGEEEITEPPKEEETMAPPVGTRVGNLAPDFTLEDINGETVTLSELRGSGVMLNFWATWCGPCRYEMPFIEDIYEGWTGKPPSVQVLTINVAESAASVERYMQDGGYTFPVLMDTQNKVATAYAIQYFPTTYFIDSDGVIQSVKMGAAPSKEAMEEELRKVIS